MTSVDPADEVGSTAATDRIRDAIAARQDLLIALRRDLHAHPEVSWEEQRTTDVLHRHLADAGLHPSIAPTGTGVICDIGAAPPRVAIRGDIDALRLADAKDVPYRSTVEGVCHACGHDVHATAALGAALALYDVLADAEAVPGGVRLILQPAEESVPGGAVQLLRAGVVDDIDVVFALHCDPSLDVGTAGISAGPITSAADMVEIVLHGPGGHTARPHHSVDLVHAVAKLAIDLPLGMSRLVDPRDGLNLTFGSIHAGDAPNVIPSVATLSGSLRSAGRGAWEQAPALLERLVAAVADPLGARWELHHKRGAPPIMNDPWAAGILERASVAVLGAEAVGPTAQSAGGEDFSWYGERARLGYLRLGVRSPGAEPADIHTPTFDVDEAAIGLGANILAVAAFTALAELT